MALIVEDATGLNNAESYLSVDDFKTYHKDRGNTVTLGGSEIEQKLRLATEYIDLRWGSRISGSPIAEDQALCFPTDYYITDPVSLPRELERATAEFAFYAIDNNLFIDNSGEDGPGITFLKEKVGPIETETEWSSSGRGSLGRTYPSIPKGDMYMNRLVTAQKGGVYR